MVLFEAGQQYFYIVRFELIDPELISFWELLKGQFIRWIFWSLYAIALWEYVGQNPIEIVNRKEVGRYTLILLILIIINVCTISVFQIWWNDGVLNLESLLDNLVFFTFQKGPIYIISYTVIIAVVHYRLSGDMLDVQLQQLSKLKESNQSLYKELKEKSYADSTTLIQVKIGNRIKMVPIDTILWIEADDYCVKIHDDNGQSHTIRSSMKALEESLRTSNFIRVHRKAIVNKTVVSEWQLGIDPSILLSNGKRIAISQSNQTCESTV